jgi:hypothetical protein
MLLLAVALAAGSCGGSGGDDLVLAFQGFSNEGITQADAVGANTADVDVCQGVCVSGDAVTAEPFTQTRVNALFVNRGKADIVIDSYTVSVPDSGVPDQTFSVSARIAGGRCATDQQEQCAFDDECGLGVTCRHQESSVELLLYDFTFKSLVVDGQCPSFEDPFGSVISHTRDVFITFRGVDESDENFTVRAAYQTTFDNFGACSAAG